MESAPHLRKGTYEDILRVLFLNCSDDSGGNHGLLPRFGQVEVEDAILSAIVYVRFHLRVAVLSSDVHLLPKKKAFRGDQTNRTRSLLSLGESSQNCTRNLPQQRSC